MNRQLFSRFAKIVSGNEAKKYLIEPKNTKSFLGNGEESKFYKNFFKSLNFSSKLGSIMIYPVRVSDVYILSIEGKSVIFPSSWQLFLYLKSVKPEISAENTGVFSKTCSEFQRANEKLDLLNFDKISENIEGSFVQNLSIKRYMIDEEDVFCEQPLPFGCHNMLTYSPCLFEENKGVLELFIKSSYVEKTPALKEKIIRAGMQRIYSAFEFPIELLDWTGINF